MRQAQVFRKRPGFRSWIKQILDGWIWDWVVDLSRGYDMHARRALRLVQSKWLRGEWDHDARNR